MPRNRRSGFAIVVLAVLAVLFTPHVPSAAAQGAAEHFHPVQPHMGDGPAPGSDAPDPATDWVYPIDDHEASFDDSGLVLSTEAVEFELDPTEMSLDELTAELQAHEAALSDYRTGDDLTDFVVGGRRIDISVAPYQVLVVAMNSAGDPMWTCGGSIVRTNAVITAAHCVTRPVPPRLAIIAGDRDPGDSNANGVVRFANRIKVHPNWNPNVSAAVNGGWDIAYVGFPTPLPLRPSIRPIPLARTEQVRAATTGVVSGWGQTSGDATRTTLGREGLKLATLDIVPDARCAGFTSLFNGLREICAAPPPVQVRSACFGDSGGPLVIQTPEGRRLAGVVSYGPSGCDSYSIFLDASRFSRWLFNVMPKPICDGRQATVDAALGLRGTSGPDVIVGTPGNDFIQGFGGNDRICGLRGDDRLEGGLGQDRIFGNQGNDRIFGNQGNDRLEGGLGGDVLNGGFGTDTCLGVGDTKSMC